MLSSQNGGVVKISGAHGRESTYGMTVMYFNYNNTVEEIANEYSGSIFIADVCGQTDCENAFPVMDKAVNIRMSDTKEVVGTNNVHPVNTGYMQFADSYYRTFVSCIL